MLQRRIVQAVLSICAVMSLTEPCRAQQSYEVIVQNGVAMKTRDGVALNAVRVPRPAGSSFTSPR